MSFYNINNYGLVGEVGGNGTFAISAATPAVMVGNLDYYGIIKMGAPLNFLIPSPIPQGSTD